MKADWGERAWFRRLSAVLETFSRRESFWWAMIFDATDTESGLWLFIKILLRATIWRVKQRRLILFYCWVGIIWDYLSSSLAAWKSLPRCACSKRFDSSWRNTLPQALISFYFAIIYYRPLCFIITIFRHFRESERLSWMSAGRDYCRGPRWHGRQMSASVTSRFISRDGFIILVYLRRASGLRADISLCFIPFPSMSTHQYWLRYATAWSRFSNLSFAITKESRPPAQGFSPLQIYFSFDLLSIFRWLPTYYTAWGYVYVYLFSSAFIIFMSQKMPGWGRADGLLLVISLLLAMIGDGFISMGTILR